MKDLVTLREEIDNIDNDIYKLIEKRFFLIKKIIELKKEKSINIIDENREKIMFERLENKNIDNEFKPYLISYLKYMLILSKEYQNNYLKKEK